MEEPTDKELIAQSIMGVTDAFELLVRRYQIRLVHSLEHALGSREDAMDAAQQAFVSAWQRIDSFRQDSAFYSWLYRIAMNAAISTKRKQRLATTSLNVKGQLAGRQPSDDSIDAAPESRLESKERVQMVREALMLIPEEFRQPLVMKEMDGFSYDEIASILGIPIGTVRSRIFRARRDLTERLKRVLGDG